MMKHKKYRLLQLPILSFFSRQLYQDIGRNWKGVNLAYLFLLLAICCVPATLHQRTKILQSLETGQVEIFNQVPEIRIQDGEAAVNEKMPYYISNGKGDPVAIIDTTGSMNYIDNPSVMVMLTDTKLIVRRGKNQFNTFGLEGIEEFYIDKHIINGWLNWIQKSIAPLSYGIYLMLSYIFAVLTLLLVAIVGLILSSLMHNSLTFKDTLRIAITAATPSIIVISIAASLGYSIPGPVYAVITLIYLFVGIKACTGIPGAEDEHVDLKSFLHEGPGKDVEEAA